MSAYCPYEQDCCFRTQQKRCRILNKPLFWDGKCHFRKEKRNGKNLYDEERRKNDDIQRSEG